LGLGAAPVSAVEVVAEGGTEMIAITLVRRANRRMHCSRCGARCRAVYDRQIRSWRHLDAFRVRCVIRAEVRRVICRECGICAEAVPWARPGSRSTRAFEDTCVWLARSAPKSVVADLMRIDWHTVGRMIERVVSEHAARRAGDGLDGLVRIGVDEVAYRKGHRYLLCVTDHDTGRLVWAAPGRSQAALAEFFRILGPDRCRTLQAVSVDLKRRLDGGDQGLLPGRRRLRGPLPPRQAGRWRPR
jgi:transposase